MANRRPQRSRAPKPIAIPVTPRKPFWTRFTRRTWSSLANVRVLGLLGPVLLGVLCVGLLLAILVFKPSLLLGEPDSPATAITATPDNPPTPMPDLDLITRDALGRYVFPLGASPAYFTWTRTNRSVPNSVVIEARLELTRAEYEQVTRVPVLSVTFGTVRAFSHAQNGLGYVLQGDDGYDYYYAHLGQQAVPDGTRVAAGQMLGVMGTSGGAARFLERQLRFAVGLRGEPLDSAPIANAADWINSTFGLPWSEPIAAPNSVSWPSGLPVLSPSLFVETHYQQARDRGLPEAAIEFSVSDPALSPPREVVATLDGIANVIRWTNPYGTRIQITNEAALFTVIISGLESWTVTDGQWVSKGQIIGLWNPPLQPRLHYMIFQNGVNIDPEPTSR